jgi:hypothetical protein
MSAFAKKSQKPQGQDTEDEYRKEHKRALCRLTQCNLILRKTLKTAKRKLAEMERELKNSTETLEMTARKSGINPHLVEQRVLRKNPELAYDDDDELDAVVRNIKPKCDDDGFSVGQKGKGDKKKGKEKKEKGNMTVYNAFKRLTTPYLQEQFKADNEGATSFFDFSTKKTTGLWMASPLNKKSDKYNERNLLIVMQPLLKDPKSFKLTTDRTTNAKNAVDDLTYTQRLFKDIEENPPTQEEKEALLATVTLQTKDTSTDTQRKAVQFSSDTKTTSVDDAEITEEPIMQETDGGEVQKPQTNTKKSGSEKTKLATDEKDEKEEKEEKDDEDDEEDDEDDEEDDEEDEDENIESSDEE